MNFSMVNDEKDWSAELKSQTEEVISHGLVSQVTKIPVKNISGRFGILRTTEPPLHSLMVEEHGTGTTHKFLNVGELLDAKWVID